MERGAGFERETSFLALLSKRVEASYFHMKLKWAVALAWFTRRSSKLGWKTRRLINISLHITSQSISLHNPFQTSPHLSSIDDFDSLFFKNNLIPKSIFEEKWNVWDDFKNIFTFWKILFVLLKKIFRLKILFYKNFNLGGVKLSKNYKKNYILFKEIFVINR